MDHQCQVATIVQDQVQRLAVREVQRLFDAPIEFFVVHSLPCVNGNAGRRHGRSGVVLSGKDITAGPRNISPQSRQCFDQHSRLNGHVQAACDASALKWLSILMLGPQCHQARHLDFGDLYFLAAQFCKFNVGNFVGELFRYGAHV